VRPDLETLRLDLKLAEQVVADTPKDLVCLRLLADASAALGYECGFHSELFDEYPIHCAAAMNLYRKLIRAGLDDGKLWTNYGFTLESSGKHEEAVKALRKAVKRSPEDRHAWYNLATSLMNCGPKYHDEASPHFWTASELEPGERTYEVYFDAMGY
jgi:tetratricopeptide (TPR) repeat protein